MQAKLIILGSNSALPSQGRHPSAQVLQNGNYNYLIDCGEGTQLQLSRYHIRRSRIKYIFISHLHGDHIYGLPGLITSYNHYGRIEPLEIFGPVGLKGFIDAAVHVTSNPLKFNLEIHEFDADIPSILVDNNWLTVKTIPLIHRVPTAGFLFFMKYPHLKIKPGIFDEYEVPHTQRSEIQQGADFLREDGSSVPNHIFTDTTPKPLTYAYLSDTMPSNDVRGAVKGFHTIYHEATFLDDLLEKAVATKHSTARQAATIALGADVSRLIIGHFSSRYSDLQPLLEEARNVFNNTELAIEGKEFLISHSYTL